MIDVNHPPEQIESLKMTSAIVAAHMGNAATQPEGITALINTAFTKLAVPNYALKRQELAKKTGLGHHKKAKVS